ncbi:MAG: peptide deformylase [Phycisphaerales bacterium]|nr:peptide deformylase [Phycisphaerales bacterium]MCI0629683.1 peptide deformylase [Phycisphaerales bacterium]MCI0674439.1 peptide deformylase [Phycisphaerales bacterium]
MALNAASLSILRYPAPALRARARAIGKIDDEVRSVAARMIELMDEAKGVGLAAPQVGLAWRLFVTHIPEDDGPKVYINPVLTKFGSTYSTYEEGCLSLPGIHVDVERPESVSLTATDLDGNSVNLSSNGFAARVWQHEFDHLNGVLIIDKLSSEDRLAHRKAMKGLRSAGALGPTGL